jgi:hypothetical protein
MATIVRTKKEFMDFMDRSIKEDDIIISTQHLAGTLSYSKKQDSVKIPYIYCASSFKREGDVLQFAMPGEKGIPNISLCICRPDQVSEGALNVIKKNTDAREHTDFPGTP